MARGPTTSLTIHLSTEEGETLRAWQRSPSVSVAHAKRGRAILLRADGMTITDIAATVGLDRRMVYKWGRRFLQEGIQGLEEKSPRRRPKDRREQNEREAG
jgi:hypothetical protein